MGNTEIAVVNTDYGPTCFPGDATVNVYGRGAMDIASLSVGDSVLVESVADGLTFAPVLGFLRKVHSGRLRTTSPSCFQRVASAEICLYRLSVLVISFLCKAPAGRGCPA